MTTDRILVVEDDPWFCQTIAKGFSRYGFTVECAQTVDCAIRELTLASCISHALVDLCVANSNGLVVVKELRRLHRHCRIVVVTGYGSIPSAVHAIKVGADDYLCKPVGVRECLSALHLVESRLAQTAEKSRHLSTAELEWEHLHRVLNEHDGNVSATARALNMHRRTLQRKLAKKKPCPSP